MFSLQRGGEEHDVHPLQPRHPMLELRVEERKVRYLPQRDPRKGENLLRLILLLPSSLSIIIGMGKKYELKTEYE